ncbi:sodium-coupled monocarboxylate transporter 1-like [Oculina patagonica]
MKYAEDYAVFVISLLIPIAVGFYFAFQGGRQKTTTEFLLADKNQRSWLVALSLVASYFSSVLLLGSTAEVFTYGVQYTILALFSYWIVAAVVHVVFIPMFHRVQVTSVNEYLEARFSVGVRYIGAILFTVAYVYYLCLVLYIPSHAINTVAGVPLAVGIVSTGIACTLYSAIGGLKAVVWTNAFHLILMLIGLITLCIVGVHTAGGFGQVIEVNKNRERTTLFNFNPNPTVRDTFWTLSIGGALTIMPLWTVSQTAVQRYISIKYVSLARRAVWISVPVLIIISGLACINGLVMYAVYANCHPLRAGEIRLNNQVLLYYVIDKLHHLKGLSGFMSACIFAGSLSSISSGLNSLCLVIVEDFLKKISKTMKDFESVKSCKLLTVLIGCVIIGGAFILHNAGDVVLQVFSGLLYITGGPLLGIFTLGMMVPRANSKGAYIGVASGLAMTVWLFTGAQIYPPNNYQSPVSISECSSDVFNKTQAAMNNDTGMRYPITHHHVNPMAAFYSTSYLWYCATGWAVTMVIGTLTSLLLETAEERKAGVDPKLVFPLKLWLLSWLPSQRKRWNSSTGLPSSDDKEDWVQLGARKQTGSTDQLPRTGTSDSWRTSVP